MPLARVSTVDALVGALRSRILTGDLPPGSHLSEVELAGAYGVGRHSLRAAFRELARDGLLGARAEPRRARAGADARPRARTCTGTGPRSSWARCAWRWPTARSFAGIREPLALLEQMPDDEPWDRVAVVHDAIHAAVVDAARRAAACRRPTPRCRASCCSS